jgi:hypothetical protein
MEASSASDLELHSAALELDQLEAEAIPTT